MGRKSQTRMNSTSTKALSLDPLTILLTTKEAVGFNVSYDIFLLKSNLKQYKFTICLEYCQDQKRLHTDKGISINLILLLLKYSKT